MSKSQLNIAFEITTLQDQYRRRGIGRYTREIVSRALRLQMTNPMHEVHLIGFSSLEDNLVALDLTREEIASLRRAGWLKFHGLGAVRHSSPIFNLRLFYRKIVPIVKKISPDVYFAPYFERGLPVGVCPVVVMTHDAIPLATGKYSQKSFLHNIFKGVFYKFMWRKQRKASLILCPSETTKKEVIGIGKLPSEKVQVVYHGISDVFRPENEYPRDAVEDTFSSFGRSSKDKYILYDAGLEANKNTGAVLELFSLLPEDVYLFVTGGDQAEHFWGKVASLGLSERVIPTGRISEDSLVILFRHAYAYLNLSSYEGFGFGPGQAMWSKVPAIISANPCFKEIYGDHALVVDVGNVKAAAKKVTGFLEDNTRRSAMIEAAYAYVQKYTWEESFSKTWELVTNI